MTGPAKPADALRVVEQLCEHFERACRQGRRPEIARYLPAVPQVEQAAFFRELLVLEIDYRQQRGETPNAADYRTQFPQFQATLDEVFGSAAVPASTPSAGDSTVHYKRSAPPAGESCRVRLQVLSGPRQGLSLEITDDQTLLVGRDESNDISLEGDEQASRFHCVIEVRLPACLVRDLNSRNGTWIGTRRVEGMAALADGQIVTCGASQLQVSISGAPAPPKSQKTKVTPRSAKPSAAADVKLEHAAKFFPGYELERMLGKGGMGLVYQAREIATDKTVALKVIAPEWAFDEQASRRFLREISAMARLRHRRIVELLEAGWIEGHLFLAMEFVEPIDLPRELAGRELPSKVRMACGLACQVLEGLRFAHKQSWVHRDLKPSNVLVGRRSGRLRAKIADFGLAKNFMTAGQSGMTDSGQQLGTLPFMAPEQFTSARDATPLMDVYSAGATLYFWLAGRPPIAVGSNQDLAQAILHEPATPITAHVPNLPPGVAEIVHRALAKDPAQRWPSADAMWKALAGFARCDGGKLEQRGP